MREYRLFWREFRQNFHTTGAILPSGRALARALARFVRAERSRVRILEVGPGTGAVTREIVAALPADRTKRVKKIQNN
jgi:phospholipid N-methyltransferase